MLFNKPKVLFLTLKVFSATGGIEKVCKVAGKALDEIVTEKGRELLILSMHDRKSDFNSKYFHKSIFHAYESSKAAFIINSVRKGISSNIIILSHINLLIVGALIKFFSPATKLVLFAHGIEVWEELSGWKKNLLKRFSCIIAVSNHTRRVMINLQQVEEAKCKVINNCLDPFLSLVNKTNQRRLINKYHLNAGDIVLLTLSRLSAHDREKGYDKVLNALKTLKPVFPQLKYMIVGKYQPAEKLWLDGIIQGAGLQDSVVFTGFVPDEELADHIDLADVYVMPSTKEGFGIIFIEAMFYGKPAIAGNVDGSVDALANGEFGVLVDPCDQEEITEAIRKVITDKAAFVPDHKRLMERFGFPVYKEKWKNLLEEIGPSKAA